MTEFNFNHVKKNDCSNGVFRLKHNDPKLVNSTESNIKFEIYEKDENELVTITNSLKDDDEAVIGSECRPKDLKKEGLKKTDIMCLFFIKSHGFAYSYAYEMKHNVGKSENIIYDMIEQCASTTRFCESLFIIRDFPGLKGLKKNVGVVTESYKEDELQKLIDSKKRTAEYSKPANFLEWKITAQNEENRKRIDILESLKKRVANIGGIILPFDIRIATNGNAVLNFEDGVLK